MGLKLPRQKRRNIKLSLAYRISRLLPLGADTKLKLYLDLAWTFSRLAHEQTFKTTIRIAYDPHTDFLFQRLKENDRVLDIGCGKGYVIERMLPKTKNITGVDYNKESIELAKLKFGSKVTLIYGDVFEFLRTVGDARFDVIVLSHVLEHIDNPLDFLTMLSSRAEHFYIEVPDFESSHLNVFRREVNTDLVYSDADHVSEFDRTELSELISSAGLQVVQSEFRFGVMKYWCESLIA